MSALQSGPVAQLGARVNGIHEVTGSTPVWSTIPYLQQETHAEPVAVPSVATAC